MRHCKAFINGNYIVVEICKNLHLNWKTVQLCLHYDIVHKMYIWIKIEVWRYENSCFKEMGLWIIIVFVFSLLYYAFDFLYCVFCMHLFKVRVPFQFVMFTRPRYCMAFKAQLYYLTWSYLWNYYISFFMVYSI